jgi:hypothetical protein
MGPTADVAARHGCHTPTVSSCRQRVPTGRALIGGSAHMPTVERPSESVLRQGSHRSSYLDTSIPRTCGGQAGSGRANTGVSTRHHPAEASS